MEPFGGWFTWAVVSTIFTGVQSFLYQKLVKDRADPLTAQVMQGAVVTVLAIVVLAYSNPRVADPDALVLMLVAAALQGALFFVTTESRLAALKAGIPAAVLFPIIKLSTPVVVVLSALAFDEWDAIREPRRLIGIALAVGATYLIMQRRTALEAGGSRHGLTLAIVAMVASVGAAFAAKYPFESGGEVSIFAFMLVSNATNLLLATITLVRGQVTVSRADIREGIRWGALIGALSFAGFGAFLQAVKEGDLAIVASINSLYILIPIVLSASLYREHLTPLRQVAIAVSVLAVVLLR